MSLHNAARNGNIARVRELLNAGHAVNGLDGWGYTPLMIAIGKGHTNIVKELLNRGANPSLRVNGAPPIDSAIFRGNLNMVRLLLNKGANVNARMIWEGGRQGHSPLERAVARLERNIARELVKRGARSYGLLHAAIRQGNQNKVRFLLEAGVPIQRNTGVAESPAMQRILNEHRRFKKAMYAKKISSFKTPNGLPLPNNQKKEILKEALRERYIPYSRW